MWLINVETRQLELFNDERKLPLYAILSHTWTDSEITLQEYRQFLADGESFTRYNETSAGRKKIEMTCQLARGREIPYVWFDTCCVDKTSLADLSEAINSMFRWYQKAKICYVYLEDITVDANSEDFEEHLAVARWFTRGWTLQELIAPRSIDFFDRNWDYFGNKESLEKELIQITGIERMFLGGCNLGKASVAKRMSWAAGRVTTRIEDEAYSLMGIFDVNMPLLYGEGSKAFLRLQEEIYKDNDDQSLFAWQPKGADTARAPQELRCSYQKGISAFAQHPREFSLASDLKEGASGGESYVVSGKGLKIEVPLFNMENLANGSRLTVAVLACWLERERIRYRPGIVLEQLSPGSFVRHPSAGLVRVEAACVDEQCTQEICVRKLPCLAPKDFDQDSGPPKKTIRVEWFEDNQSHELEGVDSGTNAVRLELARADLGWSSLKDGQQRERYGWQVLGTYIGVLVVLSGWLGGSWVSWVAGRQECRNVT